VAKEYVEYQMIPSNEQSIAPQNSQKMSFNNYFGQTISKDEESDIEETEEFEEMEFDKEEYNTKFFFFPLESADKKIHSKANKITVKLMI